MAESLYIPPLQGGGLILGYRCSSRCRHCLYGCGPHRTSMNVSDETLDALLDELAERAPSAVLHIGGGEPFLNVQRLKKVLEGLRSRRMKVAYVETSASWVKDREQAEKVLSSLAESGLECILISLSPFHAEFVPLSRPITLVAAARATLPEGAFVWMAHFLGELASYNREATIDLDALLEREGEAWAQNLALRYNLMPGGRAGRFLHAWGQRYPWQDLTETGSCRERLEDVTHFHIDLEGHYVPGLCAGIILPLSKVPGEVDLESYPLLETLVRGGVGALVDFARAEAGFEPQETYSSPCDLCTHARSFLYPLGYSELGPSEYYDPRSIGTFSGL